MVGNIGYLTPRIDHSERDMLPEEQLAEIARAEREARDEQAAQVTQTAQDSE